MRIYMHDNEYTYIHNYSVMSVSYVPVVIFPKQDDVSRSRRTTTVVAKKNDIRIMIADRTCGLERTNSANPQQSEVKVYIQVYYVSV